MIDVSQHRLKLERIQAAAQTINPIFLNSPQFECEPLGQELGVSLVVKLETLNPVRCFKGRGADWLVSQAKPDTHLFTASAGNLGQAMAFACCARAVSVTVYASRNANPFKLERMRALGATVVLEGEDFDAAKQAGKQAAISAGARFIEDSLDIETLEGAGTIGLELAQYPDALDAVLVALGNGAMLVGVARAIKAVSPQTRVIAVQAAGAPAMTESFHAKRLIRHDTMNTIADGIGVRVPIPQVLEDMEGLVDNAILVSEPGIITGMKLLQRHVGVVAEPSGAVGVTALLEHPELFAGQRVAVIVCGGNVTPEQVVS